MNNKVKFLRGTSNEYAVAEKDSDTFYFTTDDGKLYIGDKEISGSDVTIDTTLSDTSENPVQNKVVKQAIDNKADVSDIPTKVSQLENDSGYLTEHQDLSEYAKTADIPTELPANGGNANTVNGHSVEADVPADAVFTDTVYTLPTATVDTLGGVMVDGTSITANEQGVLSAVGGGGLELIGEYYAQVPSEFIVISGADLKEGDIYLLSASPNPTSAVQCYNIYTIPPLTTSVSSGYIRCNSSNSGATTQDVYFKISTDGLILYADRLAYQCYVKFYKIKVG